MGFRARRFLAQASRSSRGTAVNVVRPRSSLRRGRLALASDLLRERYEASHLPDDAWIRPDGQRYDGRPPGMEFRLDARSGQWRVRRLLNWGERM